MSQPPEKQRPRVVWWARKFGEPLRESYPLDHEVSDQFLDLLAQADQRVKPKDRSDGSGA